MFLVRATTVLAEVLNYCGNQMNYFVGTLKITSEQQLAVFFRLYVPMTVRREQNMKKEDQQDATIRRLLLTSVLTCFGHHYAHLQENKGPVTAFAVLFWFC